MRRAEPHAGFPVVALRAEAPRRTQASPPLYGTRTAVPAVPAAAHFIEAVALASFVDEIVDEMARPPHGYERLRVASSTHSGANR